MNILNMTVLDIIKYKNYIMKIYKDTTVNNKLSALRHLYDYLYLSSYIDKNIIVNSLFLKTNKIRPQFLDELQRIKLNEYLQTKGDHIQLAFSIMMHAGLRVSEVTNIKIRDIEERNNSIYIHVQDIKTNKLRLCKVFDDNTCLAIKEFMKNKLLGDNLIDISIRTLQNYAKQFSEKENIKFSVHTCRHIFATDRVRQGIRLELLAKLMGHKSINTTLLYIYISEDEIYSL